MMLLSLILRFLKTLGEVVVESILIEKNFRLFFSVNMKKEIKFITTKYQTTAAK